MAGGRRNRDIVAARAITAGTVKVHLDGIYEKLDLDGRLDLMCYARERDLC